ILLDVSQRIASRPRYYLVRPGVQQVERDFWAGKNISVLDGDFEGFLRALDAGIPSGMRPLAKAMDADHPVRRRFVVRDTPSPALLQFLANDAEYVHEGLQAELDSPAKFYSGFGLGWYPILANLDVRRGITESLLEKVILPPEDDRPSQTELYVVKAE